MNQSNGSPSTVEVMNATTTDQEWGRAIEEDPSRELLLVYADYLEERGDPTSRGWRWAAEHTPERIPYKSYDFPGEFFFGNENTKGKKWHKVWCGLHPVHDAHHGFFCYYPSKFDALQDVARSYAENVKGDEP